MRRKIPTIILLIQAIFYSILLVLIILDIEAIASIPFPIKGLAFILISSLLLFTFNQIAEQGIERWEREADTTPPLEPRNGPYGERDTSEHLINTDKYKRF